MRPFCNLHQSEVRINPRLGSGTRDLEHRASLDNQTSSHLWPLTTRIEHHEFDVGMSRPQFSKRPTELRSLRSANNQDDAVQATRAFSCSRSLAQRDL